MVDDERARFSADDIELGEIGPVNMDGAPPPEPPPPGPPSPPPKPPPKDEEPIG